jgi:ABC-type multidrug transport system ATPase subunit
MIVGDLSLKGLSGGQKLCLSIVLEALAELVLFCLDKPTSGLDAEWALQVMEFLRQYASRGGGHQVIPTIHQPLSFIWQTIDNTILLSKGKLMYSGPRADMESFFWHVGYPTPAGRNPADHYVTVVNDEFRHHTLSVCGWAHAFASWKGALAQNQRVAKRRVNMYTAFMINTLLYGCNTWIIHSTDYECLASFHTKMCQKLLNISMQQVKTYKIKVLQRVELPSMDKIIKTRQL